MKMFLVQCAKSIERVELKDCGKKNNTITDTQMKKVVSKDGTLFGLNFLLITKDKKIRDELDKLLQKISPMEDNGFIEVGGDVTMYEGVLK